ncbi:NAD(P)/FAD-dependent oxidoreductase [Actinoplanes subtropicus]|uniref:NAD(P)/FAD-dependent oxidoreductase n=1 Tax=Actinoplanes subtropicus TaxID=543632 RepID=UPI0004C3BF33|nr:FAD-binding oxidoreductase [Actinoplanes subtropicus]
MSAPSYWLHTLGPITPRPPLDGDRAADVAIVGGGYTGLWTAYYLSQADPSLKIVVLEAEYCGFGASGRNGGWASGLFPVSEEKLTRRYGAGPAAAMHAALAGAVDEVGRAAAAEGIDCDYAKGGTITLARTPAQLRRASSTPGFIGAGEAGAICGAKGVLGGVYSPHCAALHPAKLVRGLAAAVERRGVTIHEGTRVDRIARGRVETSHGTVRAGTVVRALEGYTARLAGHRRNLAPVYSLMIATEPLPAEDWARIGLRRRETFSDERHMIIYGQRTADDRLAFGGRGAPYHFGSRIEPDYDRVPAVFDNLRATLTEMFGIRPEIAYRWGGPLGIPRDWMPSVGLADGVAWAGGYVGDGVAAANLAGRTLADLIAGTRSDLTTLPWVGHRSRRWEPEPIRWLGINAALHATNLRDALERPRARAI